MDSVILYSSGIDSYLLRKYLEITKPDKKIGCVYYDIKSRYSPNEIEMLNIQNSKEKFNLIIDNTFDFKSIEKVDAFIPNRNLHLAMNATKYSDEIYIGGTASDRISDNNEKIFENLSKILSDSLGRKIVVNSPFWNVYKSQIAEWYVKENISSRLNLIDLTFSCYNPKVNKTWCVLDIDGKTVQFETLECLYCKACFRKNVVLNSVGIFRQFYNKEILSGYISEYKNSICPNYRQIKTNEYICRLIVQKI